MAGFLGGLVDNVGTTFNLPEFGLSEYVNGSKATQNTGRAGVQNSVTAGSLAGNSYAQATAPYATAGSGSQAQASGLSSLFTDKSAAQDPATAAYQAQQAAAAQATASQVAQLRGQLGQLDTQQNVGLGNIDNSFNLGANRLDEQNAVAKRSYDQQGQSNAQGYLSNRNSIMQNTRSQANALQRLLGMNGAGFSSASTEAAPYATALNSSTQLGGAQRTYGQNQQTLDTNWQDTQRSYKNSLDDLNSQRFQQQNGLRSQIAQTRAGILDKIQSANGSSQYQGEINGLLNQITGLGNQYSSPVLRTNDVSFQSPSLANYTLDQFAAPSSQGGGQSDLSPTFMNLLTQDRDDYGNLIR